MKWEVVWSRFAEIQLTSIFKYHSEKASAEVATKIARNLILRVDKLTENPYIGQMEGLLSGRKESYPYLVHTNYKIIYSVDEENKLIKVADVFDTRQNPVKLRRNK